MVGRSDLVDVRPFRTGLFVFALGLLLTLGDDGGYLGSGSATRSASPSAAPESGCRRRPLPARGHAPADRSVRGCAPPPRGDRSPTTPRAPTASGHRADFTGADLHRTRGRTRSARRRHLRLPGRNRPGRARAPDPVPRPGHQGGVRARPREPLQRLPGGRRLQASGAPASCAPRARTTPRRPRRAARSPTPSCRPSPTSASRRR